MMPLTLEAISLMLGLHAKTLYQLRRRHDSFPKPVLELGNAKAYDFDAVTVWLVERGTLRSMPVDPFEEL